VTPEETREKDRLYYLANRERILARNAVWHAAHPEVFAGYVAKYRAKHPERVRDARLKMYAENKERELERVRKYREAHPEVQRAYNKKIWAEKKEQEQARMRKRRAEDPRVQIRSNKATARWKAENPEKAHECELKGCRKFRATHADEIREYARQWRSEHVEEYRVKARQDARNRRARKKGSTGRHTINDIVRLFEAQDGKCACCPTVFPTSGKHRFEIDHIRPLKPRDGGPPGSNGPENLQLLCIKCNRSKHNSDQAEWMKRRKVA
jgi:5-methylcytosine-specific restriction endonuclease McrA